MAVRIEITVFPWKEMAFRRDMTVSQTIEIASGVIYLCYSL